jgi:hypothetical protein
MKNGNIEEALMFNGLDDTISACQIVKIDNLAYREMYREGIWQQIGLHDHLNMVMRPEEKDLSSCEQCIGGCGDVMEMALTRRD